MQQQFDDNPGMFEDGGSRIEGGIDRGSARMERISADSFRK
jgi:hypothetical protein